MCSSDILCYISGRYSFVQNVLNRRKLLSISYASVSIRNLLLCLTIHPAENELPANQPTGWHLCCFLAIPLARPPLCPRQCSCFGTHIKSHCKQMISNCKAYISFMCNWLNSDQEKRLMFISSLHFSPALTNNTIFAYISFFSYRHPGNL